MPCAKFLNAFFMMTVMGAVFLSHASPAGAEKISGKILDMLGSNIKAEVDSDVALNLEGEAVLTYRSGSGDALLGIYRIINISGRLFTAEVISNNINPTVGMQIFIANASSINPAVLEKKNEPETAGAAKTIKGTVIDVSGSDVKIKLESPGTPQPGDAVDLSYLTAAGESLPAGIWRVAMVEGDIAYATVEESKSDPMIGLKAVITPGVPVTKDATGIEGPDSPAIAGKDSSGSVEDKSTLIDPAKISHANVKAVQTALKKLGFDPGSVDGLLGKKTQAAIRRFQKSNGLKVDGMISQALMDKLQSLSQLPAGSSKSNAAPRR